MNLLRWLTFLLGSLTMTLTVLLFWIYYFLLMLVFVLHWLQNQICRTTVGPSLAAFLKPLAHHQNVASLKVFSIGITLVDVLLNWLNWFHFLILEGGLLIVLIVCMIFLSPFLDVTRMPMSTVSFLAQLDSGIFCI